MHIFWHLSCRVCDVLSWQPWDRLHNAARRTWNFKLRLEIMVLLLLLHHIFCQLLLLFCIFSNIFLPFFVHACHNTEEFSFNIVTCAFHIMSIYGISALVLPVFPPKLLTICPRLVCICLCRRYVILSLGSLQKGCKKLLCQPRIFRAAGDLYASLAIALHFLSAHFTFLYSV